ncbi:MAG TPA: efflux RND transporter periplasmic adaptor subunit [Verrucomicrobiota bacterium]|jgi:cobalt-zinc-cadmium efflux system membrane fusion protein|nr:efflux RND transporter periplasmic adaptor subunit [Verrucomicrobiota bacterium]HQL78983.1 efflux RND transporter periplasmic adaptor subunit [Verrucomicrobiota bacterium]
MKRSYLVTMILILGLPAWSAGKRHGRPSSEPESAAPKAASVEGVVQLSAAAIEAAGIHWAKAERRECPGVLKAAGKILAPRSGTAIVSYFLPGRIAEVHVRVGDRVRKGQPLVTLECAEVADAMSEYFKAHASHELAELSLTREKQLAADGIGARKNLLAAETDSKVARASLEAAEKRLHTLGFNESQVKEIAENHKISPAMVLHSPINGKVVTSSAVIGAMVDQSKEILTIVDPKLLWVDAEIYEKDLAKARIGQEVEVRVPAFLAERFTGKVCYIADVVQEETRTITVRTEVDNREERLKPGMFADVSLFFARNGPVLAVPVSAILEDGDEQVVFVREKDGFARREIETGPSNGAYRQVVKGLQEGEEVVIEGNHQLRSKLSGASLHGAHTH